MTDTHDDSEAWTADALADLIRKDTPYNDALAVRILTERMARAGEHNTDPVGTLDDLACALRSIADLIPAITETPSEEDEGCGGVVFPNDVARTLTDVADDIATLAS